MESDTVQVVTPGTAVRRGRSLPLGSAFEDEARIRRRDARTLQQKRKRLLVVTGGASASALAVFAVGFLATSLLFDATISSDVATGNAPEPQAQVAEAPVIPTAEPPTVLPSIPKVEAPMVTAAADIQIEGDGPGYPSAPAQPVTAQVSEAPSSVSEPNTPDTPEPPVALVRTAPASSLEIAEPAPQAHGFVLQFGAFGDRENADELVASLKQKVGRVWVVEGKASSGAALFFVRGGAFETRDDAVAAARRLWQTDRIDSFVRSV